MTIVERGMGQPLGHQPVLAREVVRWLAASSGKHFIDGTLGGGGHTWQLLEATAPDGRVLAIDLDGEAVARVRRQLHADAQLRERLQVVQGNFKNLAAVARERHFTPTGGCLLDLGVSSLQLDDPAVGFSFQADRLDFRFDRAARIPTAADLVKDRPVRELAELLERYGEEPLAGAIAEAIGRRRKTAAIQRADELAELVADVYRRRYHHPSRRHPATRVFQALRIAVNDELGNLRGALRDAVPLLPHGARLAVISYHSLEDRIVKEFFRDESRACRCPPELPVCRCSRQPRLKVLTRKPVRPSDAELARNPRSRSAKLRVAERVNPPAASVTSPSSNK